MSVTVLTLVAFLLRVSNLALESLDIDEADGAAFIASGLPELVARLFKQGENGPLYYLLLHLWSLLSGTTEWALRFPSVLVGTLTIPLVYVVARRLVDTRTGLLAALLTAAASYLVHYAQMVKMYALLAALATLATYAFLRALESGRARWWAGYVAAVSMSFYTHIFSVLLLPWHGCYVALRWRTLPERTRRGWLAALAALTLPYLPLGLWHFDNLRHLDLLTRQFTGARTLPGMLAELAAEYGARLNEVPRFAESLLFLALALVGLAWLRRGDLRLRRAGKFLALGVFVPVGLMAALVALGAPLYSPRYVIVALLPFLIVWAAGLRAAWQQTPALGVAGLAVILALNGAPFAKRDLAGMAAREDWRAAVRYIGARLQPGDAVVVLSSAAANAYRYYGDPAAGLIDTEALRRMTGDGGLAQGMDAVAGGQRRLWLLAAYFELPDYPPVQQWLAKHTHYEREVWFRNLRVALHAPPSDPAFTVLPTQRPLNVVFGGQLALTGMDWGAIPRQPGQPWQVRLVWQAAQRLDAAYAASLRVLDDQGNEWGRSEGPLGGAFQQTWRWQPGQVVVDDRDVVLTAGMPPGEYRVGLYVYRSDTVENLRVQPSSGDPPFALLGTLTLDQALPVDPRLLAQPLDAEFFGGIRLLGLATAPGEVTAGGTLPLALVFAAPDLTEGLTVETQLTDAAGRAATWRAPLVRLASPADALLAGRPFAWQADVPVPPRFAGGPAAVSVRLLDPDGRALPRRFRWPWQTGDRADLGAVTVEARPIQRSLPEGVVARAIAFRDGVAVAGLSAVPLTVRRGEPLGVGVAWRAAGEPARRWHATVQLLDAAQWLVAQDDRPAGGEVPSDGWTLGEVRADQFRLAVPAGALPGAHTLVLALYDIESGERLRTADGSDVAVLATVQVMP